MDSIISRDSVVLKQLKNRAKMRLPALANNAMKANESYLVEVQQDQMRDSRNAKGLNPVYSPLSQELKSQSDTYRGQWPHMDFYDTGDFQDNMFLKNDGSFDSTDWKTNTLIQDYGPEILQPDPSTLELGQSVVTEDYFKQVHKELNK